MLKGFIIIVLLLNLGHSIATAQEEAPACDVVALSAGYTESLAAAATVEDLQAVHDQLANDIATCNGLSFTGSGNQALGPLELEGVYITEFGYTEGTNVFLGNVTRVGADEVIQPIFDSQTDQSSSGTIELEGGTYVIEVQAYGDWHLTLTKIG